jgi:flagellar biosynthesis activator protein FlaF
MHKAAQAYGKVVQESLSGRDLEAHVLLKSAARLQRIQENWENSQAELDEALLNNRRLWTVLVSSVTDASNPLPQEIKNNIASLAMFIFNRTLNLTVDPQPERIDVLININRQIAAGLRANPENMPSETAPS